MKVRVITIMVLVLCSIKSFSQTIKVIDEANNKPVANVTIYSTTTGHGTMSNEMDEFEWDGAPNL